MIERAHGDLLKADVEALVNTVNTVGVMGKGIAAQFKRAYPEMFKAYARACDAHEVRIGEMHVWSTGLLTGPRYIINFPTKRHWRGGSKVKYIDAGLESLLDVIRRLELSSIALPPLGAGNGGLPWSLVRPRIVDALEAVPDLHVLLYEPAGAPAATDMVRPTRKPGLTQGRAALIALLDRYQRTALEASLVEVQKLMYFLQEAGQPLQLRYEANRYGPYADSLRHVLTEMEGTYTEGFGDGSARVMEAEPITLLPGAASAAEAFLADDTTTASRVDRVIDLFEGFETMYGAELLATVHWAAHHPRTDDLAVITDRVQQWSWRKKDIFTTRHIAIGWERLRERGWLRAT